MSGNKKIKFLTFEEQIQISKEINIKSKILCDLCSIQNEKEKFISNLIDETPYLSYYEAIEMREKLGNIYIDWSSNREEEGIKYKNDLFNEINNLRMRSLGLF